MGYDDSFLGNANRRVPWPGIDVPLFPESPEDAVLAGQSDLTCQDSPTMVPLPLLVCSLHVPRYSFLYLGSQGQVAAPRS